MRTGGNMSKKTQTFLLAGGIIAICLVVVGIAFHNQNISNGKEKGKEDVVSAKNVIVSEPKVSHLTTPLGIDEETPTFSWQIQSDRTGCEQTAYQIMVAMSKEALAAGDFVWDSGRVASGLSTGISYEGDALTPKQRYYWTVIVWDETDTESMLEEPSWFETGLMETGMGDARWISAPTDAERFNVESSDIAYTNTEQTDVELCYKISYTMEVENTTAGFAFGAQEGRYGKLYLLEIANRDEVPVIRLKTMIDYTETEEAEQEITDFIPADGRTFHVVLTVDHENLSVLIGGEKVCDFPIESTPIGSVGYYKSRSASHAWLDDLYAVDMAGNVLYDENFDEEETIFTPLYVATEDGQLKITSGMMLTPGGEQPAPLFRREFQVKNTEIQQARVYMTALGSFSLSINGQRASDAYFEPGKLAYNQELTYVTYDVTDLLQEGEVNALGIILLHGWYDRGVGYPEIWNPWGDTNALLGMLEITYADGSSQTIVTNQSFTCYTDGPVREDDLYQGEYYDARCEQTGFDTVSFRADEWQCVEEDGISERYDAVPLYGKVNEPIRCVDELQPVSVTNPKEGVYVYDFGQNFAGICRISLTGRAGKVLTLRYGEELNTEDLLNADDIPGTIWTENLLTAEATDYYVLKGDQGGEQFEPEFVFHGFRYLQISGVDEVVDISEVTGIVLSSDLTQTGSFQCSNGLVNQYYANTVWSQISNFMDNPMDCPQRDERHGWTGDAQIFSLTASYNMDTYAFYRKFLREERTLQDDDGSFADMVPRNFGTGWMGTDGAASNNCWGDAPVVVTWNLYQQYGDLSIVKENYDALTKWMDFLIATSEDYIRTWGGYGDHLSLEDTPADLSDTAWCAHSADLLFRMATALGETDDAAYYRQIFETYRDAWQAQYVTADGMTVCDTQTSYALGIAFHLFADEQEALAAERLNLLAEYSGYHIKTGFSGIGYLLPALSETGYVESAYRMLQQTEPPSLLYGATKGATTNWEQATAYQEAENGYLIDGSLNHYAFGSPVSWLYTDVLGIKSDEAAPGYKHILLEPQAGGDLDFAEGSYISAYGEIFVRWEKTDCGYRYVFRIPANTTATLTLPALTSGRYVENGDSSQEREDAVTLMEENAECVRYELLAGSYVFEVQV